MWGDVKLCVDSELSCEYLEYNERQTKTRTGTDINNIRVQKPRMYATPGLDTCPVETYKVYASHRPENFSGIILVKIMYQSIVATAPSPPWSGK